MIFIYLEVVGARGKELVADMKGFTTFDAAQVLLAGKYPPGFVADVDEYVVAA